MDWRKVRSCTGVTIPKTNKATPLAKRRSRGIRRFAHAAPLKARSDHVCGSVCVFAIHAQRGAIVLLVGVVSCLELTVCPQCVPGLTIKQFQDPLVVCLGGPCAGTVENFLQYWFLGMAVLTPAFRVALRGGSLCLAVALGCVRVGDQVIPKRSIGLRGLRARVENVEVLGPPAVGVAP